MTVGTDTYVTIEDADDYIASHLLSSSEQRIRWMALTDADKAILLRQACSEIEALPLRGKKATPGQALAFPRLHPNSFLISQTAVDGVAAQVELAVWMSDGQTQAGLAHRAEIQAQGVASFSVGDLSESYVAGAGTIPVPLKCARCAAALREFIDGGHESC